MKTERLSAFSDGVLAIIITIMVLELKAPHEATWHALLALWPVFLSYVLSFCYVAIYWNNHHHLLHALPRVTGGVLWANMHLLFWLSLIPFTTAWMGENHAAELPTALYGAVLLASAIAYFILQAKIVALNGPGSPLVRALGRDIKGKVSPVLYAAGIVLSFYAPLAANALYALVAVMWLVPDRRIEITMQHHRHHDGPQA
jgi:uncharacterized membrane protein